MTNESKFSKFIIPFCFAAASALCVGVAIIAAEVIERRSSDDVTAALEAGGIDWVEVSSDGLEVRLTGTAPDEAARLRAHQRATTAVAANRIVNELDVAAAADIAAPRFSLDLLRNGDGIQLIGLVPAPEGDEAFAIAEAIADIAGDAEVINMVETFDAAVPPRWNPALEYGLRALAMLPRSKVTVLEDRVEIEAISDSQEERTEFITQLRFAQPAGIDIELDISAPRPVVTPFSLRFVLDETGGRFETCTADTQVARDRIIAAGLAAGATGLVPCTLGLGVPSPSWSEAVEASLSALAELGGGSLTFSDADVTLIALEGTEQGLFDNVIGELGSDLPDIFSLSAILPEAQQATGPVTFTAVLDPETGVRLRGRLPPGPIGQSVEPLAISLFGVDRVDAATRPVADLPAGWSVRVMAGLRALSELHRGQLRVEPDTLLLTGRTGDQDMVSQLTRLLSEQLGPGADFQLDITYDEALDPIASRWTGEQCIEALAAIQEEDKITFDSGSVAINEAAGAVLDRIAEVLPNCSHVRMEISGHTDTAGGEETNLALSQARATSVLEGLMSRGVLVSNLTAQGYGELEPLVEENSEADREINRRIVFRLLATGDVDLSELPQRTRSGVIARGNVQEWPFEQQPRPRPREVAQPEDATDAETVE